MLSFKLQRYNGRHSNSHGKNKAFTFIELSIAIVVVGLVIGGILFGMDLMKSAKARAVVGQLEQYQSIFNTFLLKYDCEAGDCPNATSFFGDYMAGTSCVASMTNGAGNGNNNGMLDDGGSGRWYCEGYNAIRSLRLADLMPDNTSTEMILNGINGSIIILSHDDIMEEGPVRNKSTFLLTRDNQDNAVGGALSPIDARIVDSKIDDGKPSTGSFIGLDAAPGNSTVITPNSCSTSGEYNNNIAETCRTLFYYQ